MSREHCTACGRELTSYPCVFCGIRTPVDRAKGERNGRIFDWLWVIAPGALIGTLILPGVGTLIGGTVSALFGYFAIRDEREEQEEIKRQRAPEFQRKATQIRTWVDVGQEHVVPLVDRLNEGEDVKHAVYCGYMKTPAAKQPGILALTNDRVVFAGKDKDRTYGFSVPLSKVRGSRSQNWLFHASFDVSESGAVHSFRGAAKRNAQQFVGVLNDTVGVG